MTNNLAVVLSGAAMIAVLVLYFLQGFRVGQLRDRLGIKAPAVTGDPRFERAFRVHMNTLEQVVIVLPALWFATFTLRGWTWLPAAFTAVWIIGRILYDRAYMVDPDKRGPGFQIGGLGMLGLLIVSLVGLVQTAMTLAR